MVSWMSQNLVAQSTICKAKVAELCGARACARPLKPLETRANVIEESKSTISAPGVLRARFRGVHAWDDAIDGVKFGVVRGNT